MKTRMTVTYLLTFAAFCGTQLIAVENTAVPGQVQFSGAIGSTGTAGITFALYAEQSGGNAMWLETQNVAVSDSGGYSVLLGEATEGGIPQSIFARGEARWLEVSYTAADGARVTQPRVLLVSVPYAMKAANADTLGGLPAAAYVLSPKALAARLNDAGGLPGASAGDVLPAGAVSGTGTTNRLAKWLDAVGTLGDSLIHDTGTAIGIGTPTPSAALDIQLNNAAFILGGTGTHSFALQGALSNGRFGQDSEGMFFASDTSGKVFKFLTNNGTLNENMRIASNGFVGIGTNLPGATLEVKQDNASIILSGTGSHSLALQGTLSNGRFGQDSEGMFFASDTNGKAFKFLTNNGTLNEWLRITSTGHVGIGTNAPTQNLHVVGNILSSGTVTSAGEVTSAFTLTGNGAGAGKVLTATDANGVASWQNSGGATLGLNTFTGTQVINSGNLSLINGNLDIPETNASGSSGVVTLGGTPFIHGWRNFNTFVGENAGNFAMNGLYNSALGANALQSNMSGSSNTAVGYLALNSNTSGNTNTAIGEFALRSNTIGEGNTSAGRDSLNQNTTGSHNAAVGQVALLDNTTGIGNSALGFAAGRPSQQNANTTGSFNTFMGYLSGPGVPSAANLQNATAVGANAVVSASNSLVLGSIAGVNGASSSAKVGIGVAAPTQALDVVGAIKTSGGVLFGANPTPQTAPFVGAATTLSCVNCINSSQLDDATDLSDGGSVTGDLTVNGTVDINAGGASPADGPARAALAAAGPTTASIAGVNLKINGQTMVGTNGVFGFSQGVGNTNIVIGFGSNSIDAGVVGGTIGGGGAVGTYSGNPGAPNRVSDDFGTVGGGFSNHAGDGTPSVKQAATVGGGWQNNAWGSSSTVAGGSVNVAGEYATVAGGTGNTATGHASTVGGGGGNRALGPLSLAAGGEWNTASGFRAVVGGGGGEPPTEQNGNISRGNTASGDHSTVPGGHWNLAAGSYSFAAGRRAKAITNGTFVWADSTDADFVSFAPNQFLIRASGGVGINTTNPIEKLQLDNGNIAIFGPNNGYRVQSGVGASFWMNSPNGNIVSLGGVGDTPPSQGAINIHWNGSVGIGTTNQDQLLTVNGNASKPGGGSWAVFSDARLKQLEGPFTAGLAELLKLQPVRYRYSPGNALGIEHEQEHIGFVAQEVEAVIPEAVRIGASGYRTVNNDPILWTMLNAIKELKAENEALKTANTELDERIRKIEESVGARRGAQVSKAVSR